jgi:hypothetical protein
LISLSSGLSWPSSDSFSSPAVGAPPSWKIRYLALWGAPMMPGKYASSGYARGGLAVHIASTWTLYFALSAAFAGNASAPAAMAAANTRDFILFSPEFVYAVLRMARILGGSARRF